MFCPGSQQDASTSGWQAVRSLLRPRLIFLASCQGPGLSHAYTILTSISAQDEAPGSRGEGALASSSLR